MHKMTRFPHSQCIQNMEDNLSNVLHDSEYGQDMQYVFK